MSGILFLSIIIALIIFIFIVLTAWRRRKENNYIEPDYRVFFILGICFLPMGLIFTATLNYGFIGITAMGIIYLIIGLANRKKWKRN